MLNNIKKQIRQLQLKKFRDETGLFVAEGRKAVEELRKGFQLEMLIDETNATPKEIEQISGLRSPQGVIGVFRQREKTADITVSQDELILALDDIQDPGNLGTIIRTADWFGVRKIVCSLHSADCYNPKVVQATMGALARVQVFYTDLPEWLRHVRRTLPEWPVYGTLLDGTNLYEQQLSEGGLIVMGNEGNGLSDSVRRQLTHRLLIPSWPTDADTSESLNVSIATALILAEFRRRFS